MKAQLGVESVINANAQFWEQMLAMTLEPLASAGEFRTASGQMVGSVGLSGVWKGRIEVRIAVALAYEATAAMMMQALDTVQESDALDATKEIANMIAGTIKSSLPRPCSMSVPESALEKTESDVPPEAENTLTVAFRHTSGDFLIWVWEQEYAHE
jgi:CheY-specific phosphatase CheX